MTKPISLIAALFAALASAQVFAQAAGDPAAGQVKAFPCKGCHGIPNWKNSFPEQYSVPRLGGQHAAYIESALKAYKSKDRSHTTMQSIAAVLSEQDMKDLAAYYAGAATQTAQKK